MKETTERTTSYYPGKGKTMMEDTIKKSLERCKETGIGKILIFTSDGEGPLLAARIKGSSNVRIVAVTFPAGQVFRDNKGNLVRAKLSDPIERKKLEDEGILVVQGTMPLQEIITPGSSDSKTDAILRTLSLISLSLPLCVQAILMATDAGVVSPGEEVVSASADTAIVGCGALSHWLFHPEEGLDIREIICKPHSRLMQQQSGRDEDKTGEKSRLK